MSPVQPARRVALEVLRAVERDDAYANLLLPQRIQRARLGSHDAALATELTYGTLRMLGYYDRVIALAARRDPATIDPPLLDVLRLAVHQLLATRVPAHAAVDEAVNQAREVGNRSATGFVNGVLRSIGRATPDDWRERVLGATTSTDERLAAEYSHPEWVIRALRGALAIEGRGGELDALLASDNVPPRVSLATLPGLAEPEQVTGADPGRYSPIAITAPAGDPAALPLVRSGAVRIQDEGSQLAALALARSSLVAPGERWLDMCAGPGGKAALLAAEAVRAGASLVANELVPGRVGLVRRAVALLGDSVEVREGDATAIGRDEPEAYDRILLDAPCTGLGALRRRPEARWRKQPRDVAELARLQGRLLRSALAALAPNGILAYVTCSPHLAETRAVIESGLGTWARDGGAAVELVDAPATLQAIAMAPLDLGDGPYAQLWPHRHGTDAMFIALIRRTP